ncbi:Lipoprotein [Vibrio crassostreae]|nr:Lipoprotein [Vibrio crassostreae]
MNVLKLVPIALISIGLTACGGDSSSSDIKAPKLDKSEIDAINALQPHVSHQTEVNRDANWKVTGASDLNVDSSYENVALHFDTTIPFNIDRAEGYEINETHKIFTYQWQHFQPTDDGQFTAGGPTHEIEVGVPGLATTKDKLKELLNKSNLTAEEQIRKMVYANFALPIALGTTELASLTTFDSLTTELVVSNQYKPLCRYLLETQKPRTDYSMVCTLPANLSPFNQVTTVGLDQQTGAPEFYKTRSGKTTNVDPYEAIKFVQSVFLDGSDEKITAADVLIHPGIGIISMEPSVINGINEKGILARQTKWEWFHMDSNILTRNQ